MPKVKRITTVIIGEGPTEYFYLNSLKEGQRRNSVAELSEDDRQTVHEEWQI